MTRENPETGKGGGHPESPKDVTPLAEVDRAGESATPEHGEIIRPKQVVFLDYDSTLGDVNQAMKRLYKAIELLIQSNAELYTGLLGNAEQEISNALALARSKKESFSPLPLLQMMLAGHPGAFDELRQLYTDLDEPEFALMYPAAIDLVARLDAAGMPHIVVTRGDEDWQGWKISASGYKGDHIVTDQVDKGSQVSKALAGSGDGFGNVDVTGITRSVLIDDRVVAFANLPDGCTGYYLNPSGTRAGTDLASRWLFDNVYEIHSLDELVVVGGEMVFRADDTVTPADSPSS